MSKIGQVYTCMFEETMLRVANDLEKEGYIVKRYYDELFKNFKVKVIGYK